MRQLVWVWKDKPYNFNRRAKWYACGKSGTIDIRLHFTEAKAGEANHYPATPEQADALWGQFKRGEINFRGMKP